MNELIKVIIIEDQEVWFKTLQLYLNDFGFEIIANASDTNDAINIISKNDYDIALVDINLKDNSNGIELGKMLSSVYNKPFIFITGNQDSHTLEQAIQAKPSAYLLKPVNKTSLLVAIQNAIQNHQQQTLPASTEKQNEVKDFVFVKTGNKYKKIYWKDVVSLSSDGNYTKLFCSAEKQDFFIRSTVPNTVKYYLPVTIQNKFVQINRSQMVNIDFMNEVTNDSIVTPFGTFVYSGLQVKELKKRLNILN